MKEYWDIVDSEGRPTGKAVERGTPLLPGEYHPSVSVWIVSRKGEFLISKRTSGKTTAPDMWETTGGSVLSGESSLGAALRETEEELGIRLSPEAGRIFTEYNWPHSDGSGAARITVWIFEQEISPADIVLQKDETCDAKWASKEELRRLITEGRFIPYTYLEELFQTLM